MILSACGSNAVAVIDLVGDLWAELLKNSRGGSQRSISLPREVTALAQAASPKFVEAEV